MGAKRVAWVNDLHLNFVAPDVLEVFCRDLATAEPDVLVIGGDIAEAPTLEHCLAALEQHLRLPIYFVLGNHDFYAGSIATVRAQVTALSGRSSYLHWLPATGIVELTPSTGLIGHGGWADGRAGDYAGSDVLLNDYFLVEELAGLDKRARLESLHALGDEAAAFVRGLLPPALERFHHVIVLTHVPPFRDACWYDGRISEPDWLPHFACAAMGEALRKAMTTRPDRRLTVLCGHTHGAGAVDILPNLHVETGGAVYGRPRLQQVLEID